MALNTFKRNHLTPLHFKGSTVTFVLYTFQVLSFAINVLFVTTTEMIWHLLSDYLLHLLYILFKLRELSIVNMIVQQMCVYYYYTLYILPGGLWVTVTLACKLLSKQVMPTQLPLTKTQILVSLGPVWAVRL